MNISLKTFSTRPQLTASFGIQHMSRLTRHAGFAVAQASVSMVTPIQAVAVSATAQESGNHEKMPELNLYTDLAFGLCLAVLISWGLWGHLVTRKLKTKKLYKAVHNCQKEK
jgi:hypothetical protein